MLRSIVFFIILFVSATSVFAQQDMNFGFEHWSSTATDTLPKNWFWSQFGAHESTDAHSGSYAVQIWNWYNYAKGTLSMGKAINTLPDVIKTGVPISQMYKSMTGYYKYVLGYNGGANDSALVCVIGKRYNSTTNTRDTVFFGFKRLPPASDYIPFEVQLNVIQSKLTPDSIAIAFFSSEKANCDAESKDGTCCYLTVDDLALSTNAGVSDNNAKQKFLPSSNPFSNFTSFGTAPETGCTLTIYDIKGVKEYIQTFSFGQEMIIGSRELQQGFYMYEIVQPGKRTVHGKLIRN